MQCLSKIPYADLEIAERVAKLYTEQHNSGRTMRAYKCGICDGFHLSSKKKR